MATVKSGDVAVPTTRSKMKTEKSREGLKMIDGQGGMHRRLVSYGDDAFSLFLRTVFLRAAGHGPDVTTKPVIGVVDTSSSYNPCHGMVPAIVDAVSAGVMKAGGLPFPFPVISLHESFTAPTSLYLRNLMAITVEEMIRAQPMDAVVLIGGCDKTVPALLMGAASAGVPAILTVSGPALTGNYHGERMGACTDCRRFWARYRAGEADQTEIDDVAGALMASAGTCMVMGTASTMALCAEAMGMMLPGGATIPSAHSERLRHAEATGAQAVTLARKGTTPAEIMTDAALENGLAMLQAIGGSTNAVVHLAAIAGRLGLRYDLDRVQSVGDRTPLLANLKPNGAHYMQDLHAAGGCPRLIKTLAPLMDLEAPTVTGESLGRMIADLPDWPQDVVRGLDRPLFPAAALAVLTGNLAPDGAVIKQSAASANLLQHTGPALVFDGVPDLAARIDDPDLPATPDSVLVLRGAGPVGAPGMPEAGFLPIPRKLARAGVKDMVRISDCRMSGTAYGTIALHVAPEAAVDGPLSWVRDGDPIRLDVPGRSLTLDVDAAELADRAQQPNRVARARPDRGYARLLHDEITQAPEGCDFAFLAAAPSRASGG